jgi:hypothetical protein
MEEMEEMVPVDLPGADLVVAGLRDLAARRESEFSLLVLIGAPRLRALGIPVPDVDALRPEHSLYLRLAAENSDTAHSRYDALVHRLVSFERALACASTQPPP